MWKRKRKCEVRRTPLRVCVSRYANGGHPTGMHTTALGAGPEEGAGMVASKEIAGPMLPADVENKGKVVNATPGHLVLGCHAFTLAAIQVEINGKCVLLTCS